jgi:hypothetical protein
MKFVLLCAALSFVVWTAPARADEICVGPACVGTGEHRDRDRDEVLDHREHRDEGRELELREHREPNEGAEHREHREPDEGRAER